VRIKRFHKTRRHCGDVFKRIQSFFYAVERFAIVSFRRRSFFGFGRFVRHNGSMTVLAVIAMMVMIGNIAAKKSHDDSYLVGQWIGNEGESVITKPVKEDSIVLDGGVISESRPEITTMDIKEKASTESQLSILTNTEEELLGDAVIVPPRREGASDPDSEGDVILYTVQMGDTLSTIAAKHSVTTATLFWANEIEDVDDIKPGDTIFILPESGVKHKIKSGETIEKIAKEYKVEEKEIIAYNTLPANGELTVDTEIFIPGAQKAIPQPEPDPIFSPRDYVATGTGSTNLGSSVVKNTSKSRRPGNSFPYGYCTYYVANKRPVAWRGNAGAWLYNARASGYSTGKKPQVGAIVVTTEDARYGHVAYVEAVGDGTITISEMNYKGWGVVNTRTLSQNARVIRGYIY
jgi:surface antigen